MFILSQVVKGQCTFLHAWCGSSCVMILKACIPEGIAKRKTPFRERGAKEKHTFGFIFFVLRVTVVECYSSCVSYSA